MKSPRCNNCFYYEKLEENRISFHEGVCHRYPPDRSFVGGTGMEDRYNPVSANDWCGEFKEGVGPGTAYPGQVEENGDD